MSDFAPIATVDPPPPAYSNPNVTNAPPPPNDYYKQPAPAQPPQGYAGYGPAPVAPQPQYAYAPQPAAPVHNTNVTVVTTGQPQVVKSATVYVRPQRSYIVLAIISFLFGFWPLGLVAIVFSVRASGAYQDGNHNLGFSYGRRARNCGIAALIIGIAIYICIFVFSAVGGAT